MPNVIILRLLHRSGNLVTAFWQKMINQMHRMVAGEGKKAFQVAWLKLMKPYSQKVRYQIIFKISRYLIAKLCVLNIFTEKN